MAATVVSTSRLGLTLFLRRQAGLLFVPSRTYYYEGVSWEEEEEGQQDKGSRRSQRPGQILKSAATTTPNTGLLMDRQWLFSGA